MQVSDPISPRNTPFKMMGRPEQAVPRVPGRFLAAPLTGGEQRLLILLIGVWIVSAFDLQFTLMAREMRLLVELNPVAVHLIERGAWAVGLYKLALLTSGSMILWRLRRHAVALRAAWILGFICVGLSLMWYQFYIEATPLQVQINQVRDLIPGFTGFAALHM